MMIRLSKQAEKFISKQQLSDEEITAIEVAKVEIANGEYTDLEDLKKELGS